MGDRGGRLPHYTLDGGDVAVTCTPNPDGTMGVKERMKVAPATEMILSSPKPGESSMIVDGPLGTNQVDKRHMPPGMTQFLDDNIALARKMCLKHKLPKP